MIKTFIVSKIAFSNTGSNGNPLLRGGASHLPPRSTPPPRVIITISERVKVKFDTGSPSLVDVVV